MHYVPCGCRGSKGYGNGVKTVERRRAVPEGRGNGEDVLNV